MSSAPIPLFVLHWNRPEECLRTVEAFLSEPLSLSIRVIDNASESGAVLRLKNGLPEGVKMVQMPENRGWGRSFNIVLRNWLDNETGDTCIISAHDALPVRGSLAMLAEVMQRDREIGIACPEYGMAAVPRFSYIRSARMDPVEPRPCGTVESVDIPNGTLMILRRQCLEQIGLFDERYFAYGDEHEIGLRARQHQWKVVIVWGSVVLNPGTWTSSVTRSYLFTRNSLLLVRSYAGIWAAWLRLLLMVPNTLRMWLSPPKDGYSFSARARFAAMCDFIAGRFGPPPRLNP